jgi:hypothetical protein
MLDDPQLLQERLWADQVLGQDLEHGQVVGEGHELGEVEDGEGLVVGFGRAREGRAATVQLAAIDVGHAHRAGGDERLGAGFVSGASELVDEMDDDVAAVEGEAAAAAIDTIAPGERFGAEELEELVHGLRVLGVVPEVGVLRRADEEAAIVADDLESLERLGEGAGELLGGEVVGQDVEEVAGADAVLEREVEEVLHASAEGAVMTESEVGGSGAGVAGGTGDGEGGGGERVAEVEFLGLGQVAGWEGEEEVVVHRVSGGSAAAVPVGDLDEIEVEGLADELGADTELDTGGMEGATWVEGIARSHADLTVWQPQATRKRALGSLCSKGRPP